MPIPQPSLSLSIRITEEQLGFLAYLYPNDDPEDALIKLLDRTRNWAIRQAEQQVHVLHPSQRETEEQVQDEEQSVSQFGDGMENPIGELQELCQKQQISMPRYEFETIPEGFRCSVQAMGLRGVGEGRSKRQAKVKAAVGLLGMVCFGMDRESQQSE